MNRFIRSARRLTIALSVLFGCALAAAPAGSDAKHYVCVPCGHPCDAKVFDHPGTCPDCGMALVEEAEARRMAAAHVHPKVAFLIFNGAEEIDYTGPYELFGAANCELYTVAATAEPITSAMGLRVMPKYTFATAPKPDILLVPGGGIGSAMSSAATLEWVRATSGRAKQTISVCNGAFILAKAGLLDGLRATTTAGNIERLRAGYPKIQVVDDQRFVDNGRIVTTGGLTAGMDGALHLISKLMGNGTAQAVALSEEIDWHPEAGFARALLADRLIPDLKLDDIGEWDIEHTTGTRDRWDIELHGKTQRNPNQLAEYIHAALKTGKWTLQTGAAAHSTSPLSSDWKFSDRQGKPWAGTLTVAPAPEVTHRYRVQLKIARAN